MKPHRLCFLMIVCLIAFGTVQSQTRRDFGSSRSPHSDPSPTVPPAPRDEGRREKPATPAPTPPPRVNVQPVIVVSPSPSPVVIDGGGEFVLVPVAGPPVQPVREKVRFPVMGAEILDRWSRSDCSGYDFDGIDVVDFNDNNADVFFDALGERLRVPTDTDIQDLGPSRGITEALRIDRGGWKQEKNAPVVAGHQYAIWRWNGDCVRIFVQEVYDTGVVFDWMPAGTTPRAVADGRLFGR
jgi:hypothetical protein